MDKTIKVGFEVDTSTAKQQGQKAGVEFGKGVSSGLATSTEGAFSKTLMDRVQKAGSAIGRMQASGRWSSGRLGSENFLSYKGKPPPILNSLSGSSLPAALTKFASVTFLAYEGLKLFKDAIGFVVNQVKNSFEVSHQLYGKSLTGGMSLGFTANRQFSAGAMGVSEKDVFRFKQSADVMKQLSGSVAEIAKDAPALAYTKTQFKILEVNLIALGARIAVDVAPYFNILLEIMNGLAEAMPKVVNAFSGIIKLMAQIGLQIISPGGNVLSHLNYGGNIASNLKKLTAPGSGTFGQPQTFMRQMQAGAFEKMGLVVGSGGKMMDYARRTAVAVEKIAKAAPSKGNSMPRGYSSVFNPISNMP